MKTRPAARNLFALVLKRFTVTLFLASPLLAQQATVDITPGHSTNSFSPLRALGAGIDRDPLNSVKILYNPAHVQTMLTAGWGPISYRLNTELSIQAWHWNPTGQWSDPTGQGYFVGDANSSGSIRRSFGYNLPHRGTTSNYGTSGGYSVLDDGDLSTYWKSDPYLDQTYTGEDNSLHPGWILVDLGGPMNIDAMQIAWANPYATDYQIQYWTGDDAIGDQGNGDWVTFPEGNITGGSGGTVTLQFSQTVMNVEFVRVLMTASSNTCDTHGSADQRNCLGFAINEVYLGYFNSSGQFVDLMHHSPDPNQTLTYASSVDPWHDPSGIATDDGEQPGFDFVFNSGLTRGIAMTIPVAMLYDNPDNAANEIAYLENRGYAIRYVELGEEPDGQFVLPEDDAALYLQWADAIHKVDPNIKLAGPVFEGVNSDIQVWPNAQGNVSWFNRFLLYLNRHGHLDDLNVMTFEHYPFDPCNLHWANLYAEPQLVQGIMKVWRHDGLPSNVPMEITESNLAYDTATQYMQPFGAIWLADYAGSFLTAGGHALFYYQWEPLPMYQGCGGWGTFGMFNVDLNYNVKQATSQFFAANVLTQQWVDPVDQNHAVYPASTNITDGQGNVLVTAYSVQRPDGLWSLLLVNKDQFTPHSLTVDFHNSANNSDHYFQGTVTQVSFGSDNYVWHANGQKGYANPDGPAVTSPQPGGKGTQYTLPASSITVLKGTVQ
ncbi:MAG TPA: discoidin domain-containing protein [Terriglobales bacterium]|nr:discoidin domain-containing protein [Terriglobales bacterium]